MPNKKEYLLEKIFNKLKNNSKKINVINIDIRTKILFFILI